MMQTEFSVGARKFVLDKKKSGSGICWEEGDFGQGNDDLQLAALEIYLGVRLIPQNEGESLGA